MRRLLRWAGYVLVALAVIGFEILVVTSNREIDAHVQPVAPASVLGHASVERGKHIFTAVSSCVGCHGADGGGGPVITDAAMAVLNAPNLTRDPPRRPRGRDAPIDHAVVELRRAQRR